MSTDIAVTRQGAVQVIRIDRPHKKNALNGPMYRALSDAFRSGDADATIAVHVILGSQGVFCAGNDMSDFLAVATGQSNTLAETLAFLDILPAIQKPVVAGVGGLASGVGVTMLFHFDLVYAAPSAIFSTPFLNLGLVPEAGSSLLLPNRIGYQRAFEMLVLGEPFSAERAREAGFINEIVAADALEEKAIGVAQSLASKPPEALAISRRLLRGEPGELAGRMAKEAGHFSQRLKSAEALEAFTAFFEKRPAHFAKRKP